MAAKDAAAHLGAMLAVPATRNAPAVRFGVDLFLCPLDAPKYLVSKKEIHYYFV